MTKRNEEKNDFIDYCKFMVSYWEKQNDMSEREKLEGIVHSILVVLDGESELPAFAVRPIINGKEKEDIARDGDLHSLFYKEKREKRLQTTTE